MASEYGDLLTALNTVTALPDAGAEFMIGDEDPPNDAINRTAKENRAVIEQIVSGAIGHNLVFNGGFEAWSAGTAVAPDRWTLGGAGAAVARVTGAGNIKRGDYAAEITYGSAIANLNQLYVDYVYFQSEKVILGAWVKCSTASIARIALADGVAQVYSSYHTGGGSWELLTIVMVVDASATKVQSICYVDGAGDATFDSAKLEEGEIATAFSNHPNDEHTTLAFSVHKNGADQLDIVTATWTKLSWPTEVFDRGGNFASNKFTPDEAGDYFITATLAFATIADQADATISIYKNGVLYKEGPSNKTSGTTAQGNSVSVVVAANGVGDYFEVFAFHSRGVNADVLGGATLTYFMGFKLG